MGLFGLTDDAGKALSKAKVLVPSGSSIDDVAKTLKTELNSTVSPVGLIKNGMKHGN